ncbi:Rap GTPase-activating protein [Entamoeba marina]
MSEIDLDELLSTGLEDVNSIEIDQNLVAATQPTLVASKKINYNVTNSPTENSNLFVNVHSNPSTPSYTSKLCQPYSIPKRSMSNINSMDRSDTQPASDGESSTDYDQPQQYCDNTRLSFSSFLGTTKKIKHCSLGNYLALDDELFDSSSIAHIPGFPGITYICKYKIRDENQLFSLISDDVFNLPLSKDPWSSTYLPIEVWMNEEITCDCIVDTRCREEGYNLEVSNNSVGTTTNLKEFDIIDVEQDFPFYQRFFKGRKTTKYYMDPSTLTFLIVDVGTKYRKAIVKTPKDEFRCVIPPNFEISKFDKVFPQGETDKMKPKLFDKKVIPKLENDLEKIENMSLIKKYKFGVIYVKDKQTSEDEFFANDDCCDEFWGFLDTLGNKIELNGFNGYAAGLDIKSNCTGTHSYYTKYHNVYNIMFHVAPLLPNQPDDLQKLERKRHVGNDVVVIIVLDPNRKEPFDPRLLRSHFNNVFIIVQPKQVDGKDGFTINVCTKPNIDPFPPFINNSWLPKDDQFKEFMLKKLINAERMTMHNTTFRSNSRNTRKQQLKEISELL